VPRDSRLVFSQDRVRPESMMSSTISQVSHDHHRALEHAHDEDFAALVVLVDLGSEFGDPLLDLFLGVENVLEVCLDVV
jgi:hypothetical protein